MTKHRRVNVKAILADPDLRRKLMVSTIQATQAREGIETTEQQADRAYYVVSEGELASFFDLRRFRGVKKAEPDRRNEMFVRALAEKPERIRCAVARRDFTTIMGSPLAYRRVGLVSHIFRDAASLELGWGIAAQGLATAADPRFVRAWWELPHEVIGQGKDWVPFAKGGEFSRFYADVYLVVFWNHNGAAIRSFERAYIRNEQHYFKPGLTWPLRTQRGFNLRVMPPGCVFGHKGPAVLPSRESDTFFILGVANSVPAEYLLRGLMSFGSWEVGVIKRLPIPKASETHHSVISVFARDIHEAKAGWDTGNETSTVFSAPWIVAATATDGQHRTLSARLERIAEHEASEDARIQAAYARLNDEAYQLYGIPDSTRAIIEETLGERSREIIWPQMERKTVEQKRLEHVWRLLSYAVKRVVEADEDGIVPFAPLSGETSLLDRVHRELAQLFPEQDINQVEVEIINELKRKVKGYKRASSIEEWFDNVYFDYHVALYKKRPIIWHIASTQGSSPFAFGALCHYHKLDKNRMAKLRATYLRDAIEAFRREAALSDQEGRAEDRVEWQAKLEEAQALDRRLQAVQEGHHEGAEGGNRDYRILTPWKSPEDRPEGWAPDLDDGVKVNIEPLQKAGVLRSAKVV